MLGTKRDSIPTPNNGRLAFSACLVVDIHCAESSVEPNTAQSVRDADKEKENAM